MSKANCPRPLKVSVIREELVNLTNDLESAVILNQLLYWTKRTFDFDQMLEEETHCRQSVLEEINVEPRRGWIYKTASELLEETMLRVSESSIHRKLKSLVARGWLEERKNPKNPWDKKRQFRCNLRSIQKDLNKLSYGLRGFNLDSSLQSPLLKQKERSVQKEVKTEESILQEESPFSEALSCGNPQKIRSVTESPWNEHSDRSNELGACSNTRSARSLKRDYNKIINKNSSSQEVSESNKEEEDEESKKSPFEGTPVSNKREGEPSPYAKVEDLLEALEIWDKEIQIRRYPETNVFMTSTRATKLKDFLESFFGNDLEKWRNYCRKISETPFLMGQGSNGWKVSLDWALEHSNAYKVLEDRYFLKPSESQTPEEKMSERIEEAQLQKEVASICRGLTEDSSWLEISLELIKTIGFSAYKSWFMELEVVHFSPSTLRLGVPSLFKRDVLEREFQESLLKAAKKVCPDLERVVVEVGEGTSESQESDSNLKNPS